MTDPAVEPLFGAAGAVWVGAALELDLFETLAERGPTTVGDLAAGCGLSADHLRALASGLAALGLAERHGHDLVGLTPAGARLWSGHDRTLRHLGLLVHRLLRPAWEQAYRPGARLDGDLAERARDAGLLDVFVRAMHESALEWFVRPGLVDEIPIPSSGLLVDLGGAPGTVVAELCRRHPDLRAVVVDRDWCLDASRSLTDHLPAERATTHAADLADPSTFDLLPGPIGGFVMTRLSASLDDDALAHVLHRCRRRLDAGGAVSVIDVIVGDRNHPDTAAVVPEMLATGARVRTVDEVSELADRTGFRTVADDVRYDEQWNVVVLEAR